MFWNNDYITLGSLCVVHWIIFFFLVFYVPTTKLILRTTYPILDALYVCIAIGTIASWVIFKYECIISYIEKKVLYPSYVMGSMPLYHPSLYLCSNFMRGNNNIQHINFMVCVSYLVLMTVVILNSCTNN